MEIPWNDWKTVEELYWKVSKKDYFNAATKYYNT